MSRYDWDPEKARVNLAKHGVSFDEAESVIASALSLWAAEVGGAHDARRRIIGWSTENRLLVVIVSVSGLRPRMISARRATKRERHAYETRP